MNKLRLVLRNILPFCNLIGSARIPSETKGQPKNQTPFSEGGSVGVVWDETIMIRRRHFGGLLCMELIGEFLEKPLVSKI